MAVRQRLAGTGWRGGFSLVEVCLAILVVALGLLSIFGLFPSGLRASESATADTRAGLFAEEAFAAIRGKAAEITSPAIWQNQASLRSALQATIGTGPTDTIKHNYPSINTLNSLPLRYRLNIALTNPPPLCGVALEVWGGTTGSTNMPNKFYTELYFYGM